MNIKVKDCELNDLAGKNIETAKCVVKLSTFSHETSSVRSKCSGSLCHFSFSNDQDVSVDVNKNNNVFDVFIEVWQQTSNAESLSQDKSEHKSSSDPKKTSGQLIGQARLPIYDAKNFFKGSLPLLSQGEDHKMVGTISVEAHLKENKVEEKINDHKDTKN
jgi:hypothetical protein